MIKPRISPPIHLPTVGLFYLGDYLHEISVFGVSVSAWPEIQAGKPWSQPCIQAAVSGSAIFLAGEAGIGCTEGVFLVSATIFN